MKDPQNYYQELPEPFLKRMQVLLGDEFDAYLSCLHQSPPIGIRVNTLKISREEFARISPYKLSPIPWCSTGFSIDDLIVEKGIITPGKHPYHSAGLYYLQEPSAMIAGEVLFPQPGEKILDLAAAPGGKTTHLASFMGNKGLLVANDIHPKRVWDLAENLERCGVTNAVVTNESPERLSNHFSDFFDRVLLDAPCSGEGMFRKSERARKEWKPELPHSCAIRQSGILEYAARMLKPGGYMAYTTCTFSTEENERVIAKFLDEHPEFDLMTFTHAPGLLPSKPEWIGLPQDHKINRTMRIWPFKTSAEGHYIALLTKNEGTDKYKQNSRTKQEIYSMRTHKPRVISTVNATLNDFANENINFQFDNKQIRLVGSYVYCIPVEMPDITGLTVIHPGWWLGSIHKDRFTPSHALAMGIRQDQARHKIRLKLGDLEISAYLSGETFHNTGADGWVLLTVDDFPIGWGKRVQNVVKNYYPHGLRRLS